MAKVQTSELPFSLPKRKVFIKPVVFNEGWLAAMGGKTILLHGGKTMLNL